MPWPRFAWVPVAWACFGLPAHADPTPESCAILTQFGAYDTRPVIKDKERADSFRNWLCQDSIASLDELNDASTGLGVAPDLLRTKLGFNPKTQGFADWKKGYCDGYIADRHLSDLTVALVKLVHPNVVATLAACEGLPGLHARVENTASQCHFFLRLTNTPREGGSPAQEVKITSAEPSLTCQPQPLDSTFLLQEPTDLLCRRHSDNGLVLTVNAPGAPGAILVVPDLAPKASDVVSGDLKVDIAWRDKLGRYTAPTSDLWHLELGPSGCRITGNGSPWSPRSAWFTQATATCSESEIRFTGYRSWDPLAKAPSNFSLRLHSDDNGETFSGSGQDSLGNVAVIATAKHLGDTPAPDQQICAQ